MSSDFELLTLWSAGQRQAGADLFERYYPTVIRFFQNKASPRDQDDLVQQTFMRCMRVATTPRTIASFRAYLLRICYTTLVDHLRDEARRGRYPQITFVEPLVGPALENLSTDMFGPNPEAATARREQDRLLLKALRRVPLKYQVVLELHYWEDLSHPEIAAIVANPLGTVKTRLRKGRALLHAQLAELAASPDALNSTLDDFDSWARRVRAHARTPSRDRAVSVA